MTVNWLLVLIISVFISYLMTKRLVGMDRKLKVKCYVKPLDLGR